MVHCCPLPAAGAPGLPARWMPFLWRRNCAHSMTRACQMLNLLRRVEEFRGRQDQHHRPCSKIVAVQVAGPGTPLPSQLPQGKPYENLGSRPPDLNQTAKLVRVEFGPDLPPPTRKACLEANFLVQSTVGRKQNVSARRARSADVGPINPPKAETAPTSASTDHPVDPPPAWLQTWPGASKRGPEERLPQATTSGRELWEQWKH